MKILITGANGQVGREIVERASGHELCALGHRELDITQKKAVQDALVLHEPAVVINAAAYTAVDRAEQEQAQAFAVNRDGPAYLADACARHNVPLVHLSTDYVFDGTQTEPYGEDDPAAPLGVYGRSKWEGEQAIRRVWDRHLILRVSWVFGPYGGNFVKTILRLARERDILRIVADQQGCPTYAGDIAAVIVELFERSRNRSFPRGTYHYCGTPPVSWYEFTQVIVEKARSHETLRVREIVPITTAEFPTPAPRPTNSVLDCTKLERDFGIKSRSWQTGLTTMLQSLLAQDSGAFR